MADFLGMIKQLGQLQSKAQELQAELDTIDVEGTAGGGPIALDWTRLPPELDTERRLSRLTAWILAARLHVRRIGFLLRAVCAGH